MSRSQFSTRLRRRKQFRQKTLNNVVLFLVALIPIYPAFGSYMQDYTGAIVRGQYDKSTIIDAYDGTTGQESYDILDVVDTSNVNTPETPTEQPEPENIPPVVVQKPVEVQPIENKKRLLYTTHIVARGDTLSTIAEKYGVSTTALREENNIRGTHLSINQKIIIPRINGIQYVIKKGDTLGTIAQKYGIADANSILLANDIDKKGILSVGKTLILPNTTKDPDTKIAVVPPVKKPTTPTTPVKQTPVVVKKKAPVDQKTISYGGYSLDLKVDK